MLLAARRRLFRWEARGIYQGPVIPTPQYQFAAAHRTVQRMMVLATPPTECQATELQQIRQFVAANEQLYLLVERVAVELDLPHEDFWIIDDANVILLHYNDQHDLLSGTLVNNSEQVRRYCRWRDTALLHAQGPLDNATLCRPRHPVDDVEESRRPVSI